MSQRSEFIFRGNNGPSLPAVIVGLKENGLGVMRDLGRAGIRVIAVDDNPGNPLFFSRYCERYVVSQLYGEELIEALQRIAAEEACRPVLILTMDKSVLTVSPSSRSLSKHFRHSLPSDRIVQTLIDKKGINDHATEIGFQVPMTLAPSDLEGFEYALEQICPPYIIKPKTKTPEQISRNPGKAFLVESAREAREVYRRIFHNDSEVVVQQWIPGPDTNLVFCIFFIDEHARIVSEFCGRKIRQYKPYVGIAASAEAWHDAQAMNMGRKFFQRSEYTGLCAIEFKIDSRDGKYYLIEPTVGRTEHLNALATANGVPVTLNAYESLAGVALSPAKKGSHSVVYISLMDNLFSAIRYARDGVEHPLSWFRNITQRKLYSLWSFDDPAPYLRTQGKYLARKWKGLLRRLNAIRSSSAVR